mgnify:CR=1 FL=1
MTNSPHPEPSKAKKSKTSAARQASLKTLKQVFSGQSLSAVQLNTIDQLDDDEIAQQWEYKVADPTDPRIEGEVR